MKTLQQKTKTDFRAVALAFRLGYTIAIPIVVLGIVGRLADQKFHTSPLFLITGIIFSIVISTISVVKTVMPILETMARDTDTPPKNTDTTPEKTEIDPHAKPKQ